MPEPCSCLRACCDIDGRSAHSCTADEERIVARLASEAAARALEAARAELASARAAAAAAQAAAPEQERRAAGLQSALEAARAASGEAAVRSSCHAPKEQCRSVLLVSTQCQSLLV